jgi:branched-subunit amino acid permease
MSLLIDGPIYVEREDGKVTMRFGDVELVFPPELAYRIGEALVLTSHAMMTGTVGKPRLEVLRGGKR